MQARELDYDGCDLSFDRPLRNVMEWLPLGFEPQTLGAGESLMIEYALAFWLEKEGYDVTYLSNVDTQADGSGLRRAKVWLSVGHDEYWTWRDSAFAIAPIRDKIGASKWR